MRTTSFITITLCAALALPVLAATTTRVNVGKRWGQAAGVSSSPCVSGNGRFVAFRSSANNLIEGDTNAHAVDIFLFDRRTGELSRVNLYGDDSQVGPGTGSADPGLSADGRLVLFVTGAKMAAGDTNRFTDVFCHDTQAGQTSWESIPSTATRGTAAVPSRRKEDPNTCGAPCVSADGRYVAFWSTITNITAKDGNDMRDVFLRDRQANETIRVSIAPGEDAADSDMDSDSPAISADGRYVVYASRAINIVPGGTSAKASSILLYDRTTGQNTCISINEKLKTADADCLSPDISADGRYIVFASAATNLTPNERNTTTDIFLYDTTTRAFTRISNGLDEADPNGDSSAPRISGNGKYVVFASKATNLAEGDANKLTDIYVYDIAAKTTTRASVAQGGGDPNAECVEPDISDDGSVVVFTSVASNLVPGDTNDYPDIFVREWK
jgi:Tol biopolymer transport system component